MTDALAVGMAAAAAISGLSRATLYREIGAGRLRSVRVGRRRLIRVAALNAYLERRESLDNPPARAPKPRAASSAPVPFPEYARAM